MNNALFISLKFIDVDLEVGTEEYDVIPEILLVENLIIIMSQCLLVIATPHYLCLHDFLFATKYMPVSYIFERIETSSSLI